MTVTLSGDEALVLYDWLARTEEADGPAPFVDHAELRALWQVQAALERSLVAIFRPEYKSLLVAARTAVRGADHDGGDDDDGGDDARGGPR